MGEERRSADQRPVRSLRPRDEVSERKRLGIVQRVVRSLRPKKPSLPRIPAVCKILLYRDKEVIRQMHDQVIATALRDESILEKLRRIITGRSLLSGDFTFDGLAGVDEFIVKPSAKWTVPAEVGVDFELKWNLSGDTSTDNVIFVLFSAIPAQTVSEVIRQVRAQRSDTPVGDLIYPGMPISVQGTVRRRDDILPKELHLREERYKARVILRQEHSLDQTVRFLVKRPLCVLGIVQSIKKGLTVVAGAVLLIANE